MNKKRTLETHLNKPQLMAMLIDATDEVDIWGRGTGKSEKRISYKSHTMLTEMPRCGIGMLGASYMQLLDRTLPPIIKEWEAWGLKRNVDFWVRRFPDKKLGYKLPHWCPETAEHAIFYRAGDCVSVIHLIGQDRVGTSNSKSIDGVIADEAKLLNFDRVENETLLANRGNESFFGYHPLHHSVTFTTDMPTDKTILDRLLNYEKMYNEPDNQEKIELILSIQTEMFYERQKADPDQAKLKKYHDYLMQLRKGTVYFSEASTLMNSEVLGMEYIKKLKRTLPDFIFRTAILNIRPDTVEEGFYAHLGEHHFTYSNNYSYLDKFDGTEEVENDCRKDGDIDASQPLIVSNDWGSRINVLTVKQVQLREVRFLNEMYVLHPDSLDELAAKFHEYYKYLPHRDLIIPYDHTATGVYPGSKLSNIDEFCIHLENRDWKIQRVNLGKTPDPLERYKLWGYCLKGNHPEFLSVSFNAENCKYIRTAMQLCEIKEGDKTFGKDKKKEKDKKYDQREAPHFTDAADTGLWYCNKNHVYQSQEMDGLVF